MLGGAGVGGGEGEYRVAVAGAEGGAEEGWEGGVGC